MRNLRQRDHSIEQFLSKHKQITRESAIYAKGTIQPSNLHPKTNKPLKNEQFTPKTQIVIHDSHKHKIAQGLQKQTHKIHANMQECKTYTNSHKKKNTHSHKSEANKHTRLT